MNSVCWWLGLVTLAYSVTVTVSRMATVMSLVIPRGARRLTDAETWAWECKLALGWAGVLVGAVLMATFG